MAISRSSINQHSVAARPPTVVLRGGPETRDVDCVKMMIPNGRGGLRPAICCFFSSGTYCVSGVHGCEMKGNVLVCDVTFAPRPGGGQPYGDPRTVHVKKGTEVSVGSTSATYPYIMGSAFGGYNSPGYGANAVGGDPQYGGAGYSYGCWSWTPHPGPPGGSGIPVPPTGFEPRPKTGVPMQKPEAAQEPAASPKSSVPNPAISCAEFCSWLHWAGSQDWWRCYFNCGEGERKIRDVTWVPPPPPSSPGSGTWGGVSRGVSMVRTPRAIGAFSTRNPAPLLALLAPHAVAGAIGGAVSSAMRRNPAGGCKAGDHFYCVTNTKGGVECYCLNCGERGRAGIWSCIATKAPSPKAPPRFPSARIATRANPGGASLRAQVDRTKQALDGLRQTSNTVAMYDGYAKHLMCQLADAKTSAQRREALSAASDAIAQWSRVDPTAANAAKWLAAA